MSSDPAAPTEPPSTSAQQPFAGEPRELPSPRRGCSRMAVAGCAVALLLVGLGVLTLMLKARDVVSWSLGKVRTEIERTLPDSLPAAERERLGRAFDAVRERIEQKDLDAVAFQGLQVQLLHVAGLGRAPTAKEVAELSAALERFAGLEPRDTGLDDTGPDDTGPDDTGPEDTGPEDTGPEDTGPEDADQEPPAPLA